VKLQTQSAYLIDFISVLHGNHSDSTSAECMLLELYISWFVNERYVEPEGNWA